ncbi:hypothetical protein BGZ96_008878 [Linnemannia gamsii]|uniref:Uncharacterized protein n=1 Tax=Linnemannia gamsii TaxID=64522 RepID=A0ABQ7JXZ1_9FUNG|nr:hypothetical protein BGZ96_008878 [Linnemannia gamsii]
MGIKIFFSLLAVASIALALPTLQQPRDYSSFGGNELVPGAPEDVDSPRNHVETIKAHALIIMHHHEPYRKSKGKQRAPDVDEFYGSDEEESDTTDSEGSYAPDVKELYAIDAEELAANIIDTFHPWDMRERRADENDLDPSCIYTGKSPKNIKIKTKTKQRPVKPRTTPSPGKGNGDSEPYLPWPTPERPTHTYSQPQVTFTTSPALATGLAKRANPEPECRPVTLVWKIFFDKSQDLVRWRHEISY